MKKYDLQQIERSFGPNDTIEAVIKFINCNEAMSRQLLNQLMVEFININGNDVPIQGIPYKIPKLVERT